MKIETDRWITYIYPADIAALSIAKESGNAFVTLTNGRDFEINKEDMNEIIGLFELKG